MLVYRALHTPLSRSREELPVDGGLAGSCDPRPGVRARHVAHLTTSSSDRFLERAEPILVGRAAEARGRAAEP